MRSVLRKVFLVVFWVAVLIDVAIGNNIDVWMILLGLYMTIDIIDEHIRLKDKYN